MKQVYISLLPDLSKALNLTVCQVFGKTKTAAYYHKFWIAVILITKHEKLIYLA